jgi:hypothetical protein
MVLHLDIGGCASHVDSVPTNLESGQRAAYSCHHSHAVNDVTAVPTAVLSVRAARHPSFRFSTASLESPSLVNAVLRPTTSRTVECLVRDEHALGASRTSCLHRNVVRQAPRRFDCDGLPRCQRYDELATSCIFSATPLFPAQDLLLQSLELRATAPTFKIWQCISISVFWR